MLSNDPGLKTMLEAVISIAMVVYQGHTTTIMLRTASSMDFGGLRRPVNTFRILTISLSIYTVKGSKCENNI